MGQPTRLKTWYSSNRRQTRGTETSKYPEEEKTISDSVSSGERTRISPNQFCYGRIGVVGLHKSVIIELEQVGKLGRRR